MAFLKLPKKNDFDLIVVLYSFFLIPCGLYKSRKKRMYKKGFFLKKGVAVARWFAYIALLAGDMVADEVGLNG
ncbi:MAG: hypothetical protein ABJG88_07625, partial [Litorimonas sp.]